MFTFPIEIHDLCEAIGIQHALNPDTRNLNHNNLRAPKELVVSYYSNYVATQKQKLLSESNNKNKNPDLDC